MFLKRCELVGFKTFADRTELEFGAGITAIVGPNGSGKSNITDALRFCLGEASVRTMRGNRMEEMIFAGSRDRQPAGMAEVTLVFDNQDGYFPLEYGEVSLTRRMFRGGDTQYLINKNACRLKDIQELLAGTGLGTGSICMLGQREMHMVLSPDNQDRKLVLDEAAGVLKYKMRKREAGRKLEQVKENLTRLHDILREVDGGLKTAEQQVERFQKYRKLTERLRHLEVGLAAQEMTRVRHALEEVLARGQEAVTRSQSSGERLLTVETLTHQRREDSAGVEAELQQAQEQRRLVSIELERAGKEIALCDEREKNMGKDRERIELRLARLRELDDEQEQALQSARAQEKAALKTVRGLDQDITAQEQALQRMDEQSVERSPAYLQATQEQSRLAQEKAALQARLEAAEQRQQRAQARDNSLQEQAERCQQEGNRLDSSHQEKAQEADDLRAAMADLEQQLATLRQQRTDLEQATQASARSYEQSEDEYHQKSSRLGALTEIEDDYQGFAEGVRFLLRRQKRPAGVIGVVSECVVPKREHARAIESALGGHAQDVLVETKQTAKSCIELLKRERAGKVTFWPLDLDRPPQKKPETASGPGVIGWAPHLVEYDDRYHSVVMALLGRTVVVENLDVATRVYESCVRKRSFIPVLVTLEGDILAPGGSMSGGAHKNARAGPVLRRAELQALEKEIEGLRARFISVKEARRSQDQQLISLRTQMDELRNTSQQHAQRLAEMERAASVAQSRAESAASEVDRLRTQAAEASAEASTAVLDGQALQQRLEEAARREIEVADLLNSLLQRREAETRERGELQRVASDLRQARAEAMGQASEAAQRAQFAAERRSEMTREGNELDSELSGHGGLAGHLQRSRQTASESKSRSSEMEKELASRCAALQSRRAEQTSALEKLEAELAAVAAEHETDRGDLHACEVERAHYQATFEEHRLRLEELEVTTQELAAAADTVLQAQAAAAEVARLRHQLKHFGNVNLGAVEDCEQLRTRHHALHTQVSDLEAASASLREVMHEMDEVSVRQFAETFDKVKSHFSDLFVNLFGGGHADLMLTQPQNLLETGVDIMVAPPGKRLQNLALLSSGEKALTAIAFLLALLRSRPSPFVMLDELDAPLDDSNVERVARKFQEFSIDTQFIAITHNRKTMEFARVLYGVTMVDPGVSRIVAVSLEEARRDLHPAQPAAR